MAWNFSIAIMNSSVISFWICSLQVYNATALNNTRKASKHTIFFNRVPKVGSQTISVLLQMLATQNKFGFETEEPKRFSQIQEWETSLIFANAHYSEEFPRSLPPLFVSIGGMHCGDPSQKLTDVIFAKFSKRFVRTPITFSLVFAGAAKIHQWQSELFHACQFR